MPENEAARVIAGHHERTHVGRAMMHAAERDQHFRVVLAALSARFDVVQIEVLAVTAARNAALATEEGCEAELQMSSEAQRRKQPAPLVPIERRAERGQSHELGVCA